MLFEDAFMTSHMTVDKNIIEPLLNRPAYKINFPKDVELIFKTLGQPARRRESTIAASVGLLIYGFLFYADYLLLGDVLSTAAMIRFGIVAPLGLGVIWFGARTQSPRAREVCQSIITIIVAASLTAMELRSSAPGRTFHHFGFVEIIVYGAIVQRLPFKYALGTISVITIIHLATVLQMHEIELQMRLASNSLVLGAAIFILVASFSGERWERQRFLMTMLDAARVAELDQLARSDALTGLANRRSLDEFLAHELSENVAVLLLDVDAFKRYNDYYGHQQGDQCLRAVSQAILSAAAHASIVARYGGEEIVVVLRQADKETTRGVAERMRAAVQALGIPHIAGGPSSVVTVSVGAVIGCSRGDRGLMRLIRHADEALYAAKAAGRNQVAMYGESERVWALAS
ncbi:diguanylate cyclase [Methylobacterium sp. WL9]|uniref:GGDEF domain-containing protein n=1 Tax=Methylobacterium sp. WL9 TaxID=2603898 RepID=UPI0011C84752|nr:diguanylate cyclase [Methylobacterium sp. WL9]TXN19596.1 GGDEF domain-containing protein [Methylobacterium sp. WL9]